MSLYYRKNLPFIQEYDYRYLKEIRNLRNLTLNEFSNYMKVDVATLSKLESQQLHFSIHYQSKLKQTIKLLGLSDLELMTVKRVIELKALRESTK